MMSPTSAYLASLAENTRPCVRGRLDRVAALLWPGSDASSAPWDQLDYAGMTRLRAALVERYPGVQFQTVNLHLQAAKSCLRHAWLLGMVSRDQLDRAQAVERVRGEALPRARRVEPDEWKMLFAQLRADTSPKGVRDNALFSLIRASGIRRAEAAGLQLGDVDVRRMVVRVLGKGNRQRESAIAGWAGPALVAWLKLRAPRGQGPLFLLVHHGGTLDKNMRGLTVTGLHQAWKGRAEAAGMEDVGLHSFRRALATELLDVSDLVTTARQLGHQQIQTTMRYCEQGLREQSRAVDRLAGPLG